MTAAVTPGRDELAIEVMNVRRRIHGLDDLDLATLRRIKRDAGINEAFAIADALLAHLAAKPAEEGIDEGFDLRETLKAVLELFGVDGTAKVTRHVMMARRSRDSNAEIDRLEEILSTTGEPKP